MTTFPGATDGFRVWLHPFFLTRRASARRGCQQGSVTSEEGNRQALCRELAMESNSRTLRYFLAGVAALSFVTVANIVGSTNFLLNSLAPRATHSLFGGSATPRRRWRNSETLEWSPANDVVVSLVAAPSGASASSFPPRTFATSPAGSPRPDVTRGRSEPAVTGSTLVNATTARPVECDHCFRPNFPAVITNPGICAGGPGDVIDLLLLITTVHSHQRERQAQRDAWLSVAKGNRGKVRYVYLLGETFNDTVRQALLKENATYGDLLMEGFKDSYRNLTLKTLMGLKWAVTSCPRARYVMKTDDDMWVNVKSVLNVTKVQSRALETRVAGACRGRGYPLRKPGSKWHTSEVEYPQTSFPAFCSGTAYVTSMAVVRRIVDVSPSVPFFYLEDIYVGLCLKKLGLSVLNQKGFFYRKTDQDPCFLQSAKVITSHQVEPHVLVRAWKTKCANSTI